MCSRGVGIKRKMFGLMASLNKPPPTTKPPSLKNNINNNNHHHHHQLKPLCICRSKLLPTSRKFILFSGNGDKKRMIDSICSTRVSRGISGGGDVETGGGEGFQFDESTQFRPYFPAAELEAAINDMSKWLMVALFTTLTLWRHDAKAMWLVLGVNFNLGLSIVLKRILNQARPTNSKPDPGMPSSHAQSIFFIVCTVNLSMIEWIGMNGFTTAFGGILLALGSYFTWLRVSQRFHTLSQVVVGALVGSLFSNFWFWLWDAVVLQAFISYIWLRFIIVFGAVGISLYFLLYFLEHWIVNAN